MTAISDIKTEILTKDGWKYPEMISTNDVGLSMVDNYHVWSPISVDIKHYSGNMFVINCQSFKAQLTQDSKILYRVRNKNGFSNFKISSIKELRQQITIPSVSNSNTICSLSDDQIRLAGWLITDGGFSIKKSTPNWTIYQSKPSDEIERILKSNNIQFSIGIRNRDISQICGVKLKHKPLPQKSFRFNVLSTKKVLTWIPEDIKTKLPNWMLEMSNEQFDIFLGSLISGDGSKYKNKECYVLYGKYNLLSNIQGIALTHGWRGTISVVRKKDFRLNLCRQTGIEFVLPKVINTISYNGLVWSAKNCTKNILVRKNYTASFLPTHSTGFI